MKKSYRRVGAKSINLIIRISESMQMDLDLMCDKLQMSKSDFARVAIRNAITYYSKRGAAMAINNAELEEFQRAFQYQTRKEEEKPKEIVPTDEEILKIRQEQLKRVEDARAKLSENIPL